MHELLDRLLSAQHECLGVWQLRRFGWSDGQIAWRLPRVGLRPVEGMDGVWTSVRGDLTNVQRWSAATRTAPKTALAGESAGRYRRVLEDRDPEPFVTVVRPGGGGPRRTGDLLVCRRARPLVAVVDGIPVTDLSRTLVDLAPRLDDDELRRAVIEAIRLRRTTVSMIRQELPGRRNIARLRELLDLIQDLPIARCRSNAEGQGLYRLKVADRKIPKVNIKIGEYEADFVDLEKREITEIDGGAFHADTALDAEKTRAWQAQGLNVTRRPSDDAYDRTADW